MREIGDRPGGRPTLYKPRRESGQPRLARSLSQSTDARAEPAGRWELVSEHVWGCCELSICLWWAERRSEKARAELAKQKDRDCELLQSATSGAFPDNRHSVGRGITTSHAVVMQPGRKKPTEQNCLLESATLNVCSAEHQFSARGRSGALV